MTAPKPISAEQFRKLLKKSRPRQKRSKRRGSGLAPAQEMRLLLDNEPPPLCDYVLEYVYHPTRKWRLDFAWPELRVGLEVHGGVWTHGRHTRGGGFTNDREKMNEALTLGWIVIEVTPDQISDGTALRWVREALARMMP